MASEHSEASGHSVILEFSEGLEYSEVSDISEASGLAEALKDEGYWGGEAVEGFQSLWRPRYKLAWTPGFYRMSGRVRSLRNLRVFRRFRVYRRFRGSDGSGVFEGSTEALFSFCCLWGCGRRVGRETSARGCLLLRGNVPAEIQEVCGGDMKPGGLA